MNKVLVLTNDCEPLNITSWKRAIVLLLKGKAEYIEKIFELDSCIKIGQTYIPRTIKLTYDVAIPKQELPFSRENIFARDGHRCQYCGRIFPEKELTLDHVFPKSRGGKDEWDNIVTCCKHCNQEKADRTPEEANMPLINKPERPLDYWDFELKKFDNIGDIYWQNYYKKVS
jgi:5-methylcytosine-specific restriction endonuclease McrA